MKNNHFIKKTIILLLIKSLGRITRYTSNTWKVTPSEFPPRTVMDFVYCYFVLFVKFVIP